MKEFLLDRSRWHRGKGACGSALLRSDGGMCCLGLYLESVGVPRADLDCRLYPAKDMRIPDEAQWTLDREPDEPRLSTRTKLAVANDDKELSEEERELRIAKFFAEKDIEVRFVEETTIADGTERSDG